jgi:hypothetical protein
MSDDDIWREDARTDRAVELTMLGRAKTDADGEVVARHRYSRSLKHAIVEATWNIDPWGKRSFTLRREDRGGIWVMICEIEGQQDWEQYGECRSDEDAYDHSALAICRALLDFGAEDDKTMTPDQVIAMLEEQRRRWTDLLRVKRA